MQEKARRKELRNKKKKKGLRPKTHRKQQMADVLFHE